MRDYYDSWLITICSANMEECASVSPFAAYKYFNEHLRKSKRAVENIFELRFRLPGSLSKFWEPTVKVKSKAPNGFQFWYLIGMMPKLKGDLNVKSIYLIERDRLKSVETDSDKTFMYVLLHFCAKLIDSLLMDVSYKAHDT